LDKNNDSTIFDDLQVFISKMLLIDKKLEIYTNKVLGWRGSQCPADFQISNCNHYTLKKQKINIY